MELPFQTETPLEALICANPEWQKGAAWGHSRPGHPEGQVAYHIAEVLENVNRHATSAEERTDLRLIALIPDTFKYRVNPDKPKKRDRLKEFSISAMVRELFEAARLSGSGTAAGLLGKITSLSGGRSACKAPGYGVAAFGELPA